MCACALMHAIYNIGLMKVAETNSLEGWTKVTDNVLREWHDDMEGIVYFTVNNTNDKYCFNRLR